MTPAPDEPVVPATAGHHRPRARRLAAPLALALALAGCAGMEHKGGDEQSAEPAAQAADKAGDEVAARGARAGAQPASLGAPGSAEDSMYKLLIAEFAGRRGRLDISLENYLEVARSTRDPAIAERAVRIAVFARDEAKGLEAAQLWTEVAPDSTDARQVYAALLIRAGELDAGVVQLEAAIGHFPGGSAEAFARIGDMLARERDKVAALTVMERLVGTRGNDAAAQAAYAQLLARTGKIDEALAVYERVMELDPNDEQTTIIYAGLLQRQGHTQAALDSLAKALKKNPDAQRVRLTYARLLVEAKRYDEARDQFVRLSKDSPDNADVRYALGLLLLQTNHFDDAGKQFDELIKRRQRVDAAYYYLGQIAESQQKVDAALAAYRKVVDGEHRLNAQIRTAVLLAERGDVDQARRHLHGVRGDNIQEAIRIYRAEAEILANDGQMEQAMLVYDGALDELPKETDLLYARAMLAEKMDKLDVVERDLRDIISREPNNADALNALGYTLADRTDRYEEAYELIKRAYDIKPDDHYVIDSMGWVLYRMGRYQEALVHLRRAMEINRDPEIAAHLGEVLWVMGNKDAAREIWDAALKSTPEDKRLLDVKKRFGL